MNIDRECAIEKNIRQIGKDVIEQEQGVTPKVIKGVFYLDKTVLYLGSFPPSFMDWNAAAENKRGRWGYVWTEPYGACDSNEECEEEMGEACSDSNNGDVDPDTVKVVTHANGSQTCSGNCTQNGAIAFQICNAI